MRQLLFQADWPECEPCLWTADDRLVSRDLLSAELNARTDRWAERYVHLQEEIERDDAANDSEQVSEWRREAWQLLADLNQFLMPSGYLVWPSPVDHRTVGFLADEAPTAVNQKPERISLQHAQRALAEINLQLSARGLDSI